MNFNEKNQLLIDSSHLFNLENKFNFLNLNCDLSSSSSSSSSSSASSNFNEEATNDEIAFYNLNNLINLIDGGSSPSIKSSSSSSSSLLSPKITCGYSGRAKSQDNSYFRCDNEAQTIGFGDDVGFILDKQTSETSKVYYFGIADGVSANRQRGYDARLFPSALLNACTSLLQLTEGNFHPSRHHHRQPSCSSSPSSFVSSPSSSSSTSSSFSYLTQSTNSHDDNEDTDCAYMYEILMSAHNRVQEQCVYGSSTVCLLALRFFNGESKCLLSSCNLGDSGYMLIRDGRVLFKSESQSHRYNAPYQIGCTPPELLEHDLYRDK
jgi:hypothetical protein